MTNDKNKSEYSLIRLTLQKNWNVILGERDTDKSTGREFTVFGYYDRLIYENIDNWYAFRPGIINARSSTKDFSDEYTLRLVAPNWAKKACETLADSPVFDYEYFDCFGVNEADKQKTISKIPKEKFTIFSVLLINCSDKKLKNTAKLEDFFNDILDAVVNSLNNKDKSDLLKLKIGIFLSLGYSEFAILFSGNSIIGINQLIDKIRSCLLGKYASSTYTILGFDEKFTDSEMADEKINATIDFSIASGKTLEESDFLQFFVCNLTTDIELAQKKKWANLSESEWKNLREVATDKFSYSDPVMLMGAIDWRWELRGCKLKQFLHAYKGDANYDGKLKSFGNNSDLFKTVHTKLQLERSVISSDSSENLSQEKMQNNDDDTKFEQAYCDFETLYNQVKATYFVHRRSLYAMQGIKYLYKKVVDSSYGGDVKKLVKPLFHDFLDFINSCMRLMLSSDKTMEKEKKEFLAKTGGCDIFLQNYIQKFRDFFEPYLFAIYRSDHAFFEGQSLVHPSIGSVAKLLFCYNQVLYSWEEKYCDWESRELESDNKVQIENIDLTYLVTSGGVDSTNNWDLFDNISDFVPSAASTRSNRFSRPIIVMMSEAGLYDIKGTLFKLAHEFFHKRGKRMRELRVNSFIEDICYHVADWIADWFIDEWLCGKIYNNIYYIKEFDKRNAAKKEGKYCEELYQEVERIFVKDGIDIRCEFKKDIIGALVPVLYNEDLEKEIDEAFSKESREKWYGRNLKSSCKKIIEAAWKLKDNDFWDGYTFKPDSSDQRIDTLRKKISLKLYECGKKFSAKIFLPSTEGKTAYDTGCEERGISILGSDFEIDSDYIDESSFIFDRKEKIREVMWGALNKTDMFDAWGSLAKECFADCLAVRTMVQNDEDPNDLWGKKQGILSYLLTYLFERRNPNEQWNITDAQKNDYWVYRIFIIKELLEWDNGPEGEALENMIGTWYDVCFYPGQNKSGDRKKYIKYIANAWGNLKKSWEPKFVDDFMNNYKGLINYLKKCIEANDSLCKSMREVHISVFKDSEDTIKAYSEFVFEKWMEIYRDRKRING